MNQQTNELSEGSQKLITVECDFQINEKCRKKWQIPYRVLYRTRMRNNGKNICLYCSRTLKFSGRNNPNCKYKNVDDNLLDVIDTEEKAYLLGWIASDGALSENNSLAITVHNKDIEILYTLRSIVSDDLIVRPKTETQSTLLICSKNIVLQACSHLGLQGPGNKTGLVNFPSLSSDFLKWAFLRGLFDGDGSVSEPAKSRYPQCNISSSSTKMREAISKFCGIPCYVGTGNVEWWGINALDFLGHLYDSAGELSLSRKYLLYRDWAAWIPALMTKGSLGHDLIFRWYKTHEEAVPPYKSRPSDSGWDLTLIRKVEEVGQVTFYGTGLKITPDYGWYFELFPRSSIAKTGYIMANSVGVIDRGYTGEILVPLIKIDSNMPDIQLPARIVQIVPSPIIHAEFIEVDKLSDTKRGDGGFGSTNIGDIKYENI